MVLMLGISYGCQCSVGTRVLVIMVWVLGSAMGVRSPWYGLLESS